MIDEKKLIERLKGYKSEWKLAEPFHEGIASGLQIAIEATEKQPKVVEWIPVSERLPEEETMVLCTEKGTGKLYKGWFLNIEDVGVRWLDSEGFSMEVIAWMPLPEPYRQEE